MYGFNKGKCKFCGCADEYIFCNGFPNDSIHICSLCGIYTLNELTDIASLFLEKNDKNDVEKLSAYASYFYYNKQTVEQYQHNEKRKYVGSEESLNLFKRVNDIPDNVSYSIVSDLVVESFIPKKINDKEFFFLKDIYNKRNSINNFTEYTIEQILSATFVIRQKDFADNYIQYNNFLSDLEESKYIEIFNDGHTQQFVKVRITTKGIKYVEEGDKKMANSNSGTITNYGNMVLNSNVQSSIIGDGNSSTNFDYQALRSVIDEIEKLYKKEESFSLEEINQMASDIDEIKIAIQQQNLPVIQKCLNSIKGFVANVSAGIIASGIWAKIQPFILQIPGM